MGGGEGEESGETTQPLKTTDRVDAEKKKTRGKGEGGGGECKERRNQDHGVGGLRGFAWNDSHRKPSGLGVTKKGRPEGAAGWGGWGSVLGHMS